jgi:putative transposase
MCYHVLNRGNARAEVFHKADDYAAFLKLLPLGMDRLPMRIVGFCLMPNHFHMVLWPHNDGDLGRFMQWLLTSHVRRYHRHYKSSGHVWQGRFKAFPIQQDEHLLAVLRYVERNPLRARLVKRAENWNWSSLRERLSGVDLVESARAAFGRSVRLAAPRAGAIAAVVGGDREPAANRGGG